MAKPRGYQMVETGILLMLAAMAPAGGCGPSTPSSAAGEVEVKITDQDRLIDLQVGQTLVVRLESNPSTGYSWERTEPDDQLLVQTDEPEFSPQSSKLGASGVEARRFKAVGLGETTLELVYHRPWEKGTEPLQIFSIQVRVRR